MGIEDPNRYVVGNSLNSLNPITGQPEFFFKKIWRAAKKVFKKVAPVLAPIVGNMIMPGLGGIVASALTTKLMGGSWGDALKAGALSYAGGALTQGIGGALSDTALGSAFGIAPGGTFMGGLTEGLSAPFDAVGGLFSGGAESPLSQGIFGPRSMDLLPESWTGGAAGTAALKKSGPMGLYPKYRDAKSLGIGADVPAAQPDIVSGATPSPVARDLARLQIPEGSPVEYMPEAPAQVGRGVPVQRGLPRLGAPSPEGRFILASDTQPSSMVRMEDGQRAYVNRETAQMLQKMDAEGLLVSRPGARDALINANLSGPSGQISSGPFPPSGPSATPGYRTEIIDGHKVMITPTGQTIHLGAAPKPDVSFYEDPKFYGQVAAGAVPAGIAYLTADDPDDDPEGNVQKLPSTHPKRIAYDKWVLLDDKNSPEALALRDTWYGKPKYSMADLQSNGGPRN